MTLARSNIKGHILNSELKIRDPNTAG